MDFEKLKAAILAFEPCNEQEASDKEVMLRMISTFGNKTLSRTCPAHFTTSCFLFNHDYTKVFMCWHLIDKSWSWLGGHADDEADLMSVIKREISEESGIPSEQVHFLNSGNISALTIFAIPGHIKKGKYVTSHVHMDCAFVAKIEEDDTLSLTIKPDENNGLAWIALSDLENSVEDKWKVQYVFSKFFKFIP